jgi:hypothetical protein
MSKMPDVNDVVRAGVPYATATDREPVVPVLELDEIDDVAARLGLRCRVSMFPSLRERVDPGSALARLRNVLYATRGDPSLDVLRAAVLRGARPDVPRSVTRMIEARRFVERARAGVGGVSVGGTRVALDVIGRDGPEMVLYMLWMKPLFGQVPAPPTLIVGAADDFAGNLPGYLMR